MGVRLGEGVGILEGSNGIGEIDTVLFPVGLSLVGIPLEAYEEMYVRLCTATSGCMSAVGSGFRVG